MEATDMAWAIEEYELLVNRYTPLAGPLPDGRRLSFWDTVSHTPRDVFEFVMGQFKATWDVRDRHGDRKAPTPADLMESCRQLLARRRQEEENRERELAGDADDGSLAAEISQDDTEAGVWVQKETARLMGEEGMGFANAVINALERMDKRPKK